VISVLVPYRPDGGHRDRAWEWIRRRWTEFDVELVIEADDGGEHPGEFNHPRAINRAAARAAGDVFIVADADTAFDPAWVRDAVHRVTDGAARWCLPRCYDKLTEASTAKLLAGAPTAAIGAYDVEWCGDSVSWAGLVVVPREAFDRVGGYDERIAWWGADDVCFGLTMDALWGRHTRVAGAAMHLWHPQPSEHTYGHRRHPGQQALVNRYVAAAENPEAIRKVRFG
jgi:hypothetical protein